MNYLKMFGIFLVLLGIGFSIFSLENSRGDICAETTGDFKGRVSPPHRGISESMGCVSTRITEFPVGNIMFGLMIIGVGGVMLVSSKPSSLTGDSK